MTKKENQSLKKGKKIKNPKQTKIACKITSNL